jgi:hypothetical protein
MKKFAKTEAPTEIAFFLYSGMTALDTIGPHEVLSRLPGAVVRRVAKQQRSPGRSRSWATGWWQSRKLPRKVWGYEP